MLPPGAVFVKYVPQRTVDDIRHASVLKSTGVDWSDLLLFYCYVIMASSENVEILEGSAPTTGGIVVRKKKSEKGEDDKPKVSLLGLDRLAGT